MCPRRSPQVKREARPLPMRHARPGGRAKWGYLSGQKGLHPSIHPARFSCRTLLSTTYVCDVRSYRVRHQRPEARSNGNKKLCSAKLPATLKPSLIERYFLHPRLRLKEIPFKEHWSIALFVSRLRNCFSGQELYRVSDGYFNTLSRFSFSFLIVLRSRHITFWTKNKYNTSLN